LAKIATRPSLKRRDLLRLAAAATAVAATRSFAAPRRAGADVVISRKGGAGTVASVAAALELAGAAGRPFRIFVEPGLYEEKLRVAVPGVTLAGAGPATVLSFGAGAAMPGPDGKPWGTSGSASVTVEAADVTLADLTIANSFDFLGHSPSGPFGGRQAVALSLAAGAARTIVRDCAILGYQDSFYLREGRALVERCRISGGTDFIFGGAAALLRRCEIVSRHVPGAAIQGYVAAPSTPASQEAGLVFDHCRLTREPGVPDATVFLGRPWRAGGNMALAGMAAFLDCWMDRHIRPEGWAGMGYRAPGGPQGWLTPQQARLYERGSRGPGAGRPSDIRRPLPPDLARIGTRLFGDWRP
jgi:pectinesterase